MRMGHRGRIITMIIIMIFIIIIIYYKKKPGSAKRNCVRRVTIVIALRAIIENDVFASATALRC